MKKIKFTGTIETFYFIPNCDEETAVIYLDVTTEQEYPNGRAEVLIPPKRMRFLLNEREAGMLAKNATVAHGDKMSIYATEDAKGDFSYSIHILEPKVPIIDAKEYIRHLPE